MPIASAATPLPLDLPADTPEAAVSAPLPVERQSSFVTLQDVLTRYREEGPCASAGILHEAMEQHLADTHKELEAVRESARRMLKEIGWARGQFGSFMVSADGMAGVEGTSPAPAPSLADWVSWSEWSETSYRRMNAVIGDKVVRAQLYEPDPSNGDYIPRIGGSFSKS